MGNVYKKRIRAVQQRLKKFEGVAGLLVSSAPPQLRSRDTFHPYRQDSNFYYLTGSKAKDCTLLILKDQSLLYTKPVDPTHVVWEGKPIDTQLLAKELGAELDVHANPERHILKAVGTLDTLVFQNTPGTATWWVADHFLKLQSAFRRSGPIHFHHIDSILAPLRIIKEAGEIKLIEGAIAVTFDALKGALPLITTGSTEHEIASALAYRMSLYESTPSFPTIAATGKSAATLHYEELQQRLKRGDLFLLDFGAELAMYAGDITRVFPVSGKFSGWQEDLYDIVLAAQKAALSKVKHGVKINTVYAAAARILTEGLVDLKVLKGNHRTLYSKGAYREFFPHGIGHSLGMDVHDIGHLRGNNAATLEAGMVFTIEPGLYFPKKRGSVAASGVRIEDDILVTKTGYRNLSLQIPKEKSEIEDFLATFGA